MTDLEFKCYTLAKDCRKNHIRRMYQDVICSISDNEHKRLKPTDISEFANNILFMTADTSMCPLDLLNIKDCPWKHNLFDGYGCDTITMDHWKEYFTKK